MAQTTTRRKVKKILTVLLAACVVIAAIHLLSALTLDRIVQYSELTLTAGGGETEGAEYRAAFLTDLHRYPDGKLQKIVEKLNERGVDLVLLGGDFANGERRQSQLDTLLQIDAPLGIYGVEGNHDKADNLRADFERRGMTLLENSGVQAADGLYIGGVEDLWNRDADVAKAVQAAAEGDVVLLIAHNPDVAAEQDLTNVNLVLSGHTHGGEVTFFGLWKPAMGFVSKYGQRFSSGWCETGNGAPVYVSRGVGNHFPVRVFCRPEVVLVNVVTAGNREQ